MNEETEQPDREPVFRTEGPQPVRRDASPPTGPAGISPWLVAALLVAVAALLLGYFKPLVSSALHDPDAAPRAVTARGDLAADEQATIELFNAASMSVVHITNVGVEPIDRACRPLVHACLEGLRTLPVELLTPNEPDAIAGILSFRHPSAAAIHQHLRRKNIHVMSHAGRLRVAIHGYNTMADVEAFLKGLCEGLGMV